MPIIREIFPFVANAIGFATDYFADFIFDACPSDKNLRMSKRKRTVLLSYNSVSKFNADLL
jgi:hypothetical protein